MFAGFSPRKSSMILFDNGKPMLYSCSSEPERAYLDNKNNILTYVEF